jgi:hypothetical protein
MKGGIHGLWFCGCGAGSVMRHVHCMAILIAVFACFLRTACAQPEIIQDAWYVYDDINYFSPIGQTFTPVVTSPVSVAFNYSDFNQLDGPNTLALNLYSGANYVGTPLASTTITLPTGFLGFYPADFPTVTLSAGSVYTAMVVAPTVRWGIALDNQNVYAGGEAIQWGFRPDEDLTFEVDAIPEPTTGVLIILTVAMRMVSRRREQCAIMADDKSI